MLIFPNRYNLTVTIPHLLLYPSSSLSTSYGCSWHFRSYHIIRYHFPYPFHKLVNPCLIAISIGAAPEKSLEDISMEKRSRNIMVNTHHHALQWGP